MLRRTALPLLLLPLLPLALWILTARAQPLPKPDPADPTPSADPADPAPPTDTQQPEKKDEQTQVERGRYLVHHVAMCIECHTRRDQQGELSRIQLLQGAPVPFASPYPSGRWAVKAPAIAGLPRWREATVVALLQEGSRPDGYTPLPPMPSYRMNEQDAQAVVAYLLSLDH